MTTTATRFETVIGLEVHAQLLTRSKMFCGCSARYTESAPNTHVCPVCLGAPGSLPVINRQAVEYTVMTGLALHCEIPERAKFDRKNYPYPDLMKGYQISEYDQPLCLNGWLEIDTGEGPRRIGITRIHLEEDTARLVHRSAGSNARSLVDVNRSGTPLMEIVSEPDMRSPAEAREYLVRLRQILRYLGVSDANMEEGNFRCDANVSLRPMGATALGTKVEIKNMNSFRSVFNALEFEVVRQAELLERGERIAQETRGWVETSAATVSQRSKEQAHDYRYFPEPDLPPLELSREWVEELRSRLPELPAAKLARFGEEYGLSTYDAGLLAETRERADYFEEAARGLSAAQAKNVANWILVDIAHLQASAADGAGMRIRPAHLRSLLELQEAGTISTKIARQILEVIFASGEEPNSVIERLGLTQIGAAEELESVVEQVIAANPRAVEDFRSGKEPALKFLVGQVMKETRGRANPGVLQPILQKKLQELG
jgi:aspartyl-tRNA(Asn)/glutamyl-tRNA(Gln) amidotransferase subunit B